MNVQMQRYGVYFDAEVPVMKSMEYIERKAIY